MDRSLPVLRRLSLPLSLYLYLYLSLSRASLVIPVGKPFEILPSKVRTKPRRLSRLAVVCLGLGFPSANVFFPSFLFGSLEHERSGEGAV